MYKGDTTESRRTDPTRQIRAPRGTTLSCRNWHRAVYRNGQVGVWIRRSLRAAGSRSGF